MTGLLKSILYPQDGTRKAVKEGVVASRVGVERAVTRFEETISELLDKNDKLTGRDSHARQSPSQ
jgi:hypothetical protein